MYQVLLPCLALILPPERIGQLTFDAQTGTVVGLIGASGKGELVAGHGDLTGRALMVSGIGGDLPRPTWTATQRGDGAVLIAGHVESAEPGVRGASLAIRGIPDTLNAIVPAISGIRFTGADAPASFRADWPITWEAALVIFEGDDEGFLVMAEDREHTFKALVLTHRRGFWDLELESHNHAPFSDKLSHKTVLWAVTPYEGDWRVAARRYRQWLGETLPLAQAKAAQPPWVREIRLCVIMQPDLELLGPLAARCDPTQTLLYVPNWRADGYDRNYPDYTPLPDFKSFIDEAHRYGFRVMPHANYFGCDPKHPLYERFAPCQLRDPDTGELLWWTWDRADPPIKFAYVHPGSQEWRDELSARLVRAYEQLGFDAIHIDQTLCVYNHAGGLVDGMSCAEGNLALHEQLRRALPEVALSGEGLDEVTFVYEAFAQRHVWGINHADGVYYRGHLEQAHPICAYLFTPHTTVYGYLGMASPGDGQLYSAWRHAYRRQNVIPTVAWPSPRSLAAPSGFWSLALAEAQAWQEHRLVPATDGDWPPDVCYPYHTGTGERAAYRDDAGTVLEVAGREVARTLTGVSSTALPGSIAGWRYYDRTTILGLDPERWYAYDPTPRDLGTFHVERAPDKAKVTVNAPHEGFWRVCLEDMAAIVSDLASEGLRLATCGVRLDRGSELSRTGSLDDDTAFGARVAAVGDTLHFHPAWLADANGEAVRGAAFARYSLHLPADADSFFEAGARLAAEVAGRSDGVAFTVTASSGGERLSAECVATDRSETRLALDLAPMRGRTVTLEISCDDGPGDDPSFDWARLVRPRVICKRHGTAEVRLVGLGDRQPLGAARLPAPTMLDGDGWLVTARFPGAVYFGRVDPLAIDVPCDLTSIPWRISYRDDHGTDLPDPGPFAGMQVAPATCGGVELQAVHTHPPSRGQLVLQAFVALPLQPVRFTAQIGLRDGSKSHGVMYSVWADGAEHSRTFVLPSGWQPIEADLSHLAGLSTVLELVVDSAGTFDYDWAAWGAPRIVAR